MFTASLALRVADSSLRSSGLRFFDVIVLSSSSSSSFPFSFPLHRLLRFSLLCPAQRRRASSSSSFRVASLLCGERATIVRVVLFLFFGVAIDDDDDDDDDGGSRRVRRRLVLNRWWWWSSSSSSTFCVVEGLEENRSFCFFARRERGAVELERSWPPPLLSRASGGLVRWFWWSSHVRACMSRRIKRTRVIIFLSRQKS